VEADPLSADLTKDSPLQPGQDGVVSGDSDTLLVGPVKASTVAASPEEACPGKLGLEGRLVQGRLVLISQVKTSHGPCVNYTAKRPTYEIHVEK
jgi:hypothetical protein